MFKHDYLIKVEYVIKSETKITNEDVFKYCHIKYNYNILRFYFKVIYNQLTMRMVHVEIRHQI